MLNMINLGHVEYACVHTKLLQALTLRASVSDSASSWTTARQAPQSMDFPGKSTRVGCHALPQGIFPTQGWNLCLLRRPVLAGMFFTTSATWEA